jgi:parvulin-like peptidyl-prolyl cis-trans isomerase-like protein
MRRLGLMVLVLSVAGCGALHDAFSAHPVEAATVGDQELTVERLADLSSKVKGMPLQADNVQRLADLYVDYTLFALALADGKALTDSATVLAAMWPLVSQLKYEHFHERLAAARTHFAAAQVDSAYQAGNVRMFQHILLQVPPSATPAVSQQKETQAKGLLAQINAAHGANFAALARRYSDDPGSKQSGGMLNASGRGAFVPQFEDAAWQLAPGGVSGVVRSSFGYHIIRRPPLAEVRDSFTVGLQDVMSSRQDSLYMAGIDTLRRLKITDGAGAAVREAIQDVNAARTDGHTLVSYRGGSFKVRDLIHWIHALDPQVSQAIPTASDAQISQLLRALTQRSILLNQADSAGVRLTAEDWAELRAAHDSTMQRLETALELNSQVLHDSATTPAGRVRLATTHVDAYLDKLVGGRSTFVPVPPFLADALRAGRPWSVNQAAIVRAAERGRAMRTAADSLRGQPRPNNEPVPGVRPAPGPAPIPGAAPARRP